MGILEWIGGMLMWVWDEPMVAKSVLGVLTTLKGMQLSGRLYARITGNIPTPQQGLLFSLIHGLTESKNGWKREGENGISCNWKPSAADMPPGHTCNEATTKPVEVKVVWDKMGVFSPVGGKVLFNGKDMTNQLVPWHRNGIMARAGVIKAKLDGEAAATEITTVLAGKT